MALRSTRVRLAILIVACVAIIAVLSLDFVVPRVRSRMQSDELSGPHLTLKPVVSGLKEPTFIAWPPDGSQRAFILERAGLVRITNAEGQLSAKPLLELSQQVSLSTEEGLLGLAFDPGFAQNGYFYVDYTGLDASINVVRYTFGAGHPDTVDPSTARLC